MRLAIRTVPGLLVLLAVASPAPAPGVERGLDGEAIHWTYDPPAALSRAAVAEPITMLATGMGLAGAATLCRRRPRR
jgi:hypothetical protein